MCAIGFRSHCSTLDWTVFGCDRDGLSCDNLLGSGRLIWSPCFEICLPGLKFMGRLHFAGGSGFAKVLQLQPNVEEEDAVQDRQGEHVDE
jgi:hypothetical protein